MATSMVWRHDILGCGGTAAHCRPPCAGAGQEADRNQAACQPGYLSWRLAADDGTFSRELGKRYCRTRHQQDLQWHRIIEDDDSRYVSGRKPDVHETYQPRFVPLE